MKFSQLAQNTRILLYVDDIFQCGRKFGNKVFFGKSVHDGVLRDCREDVLVEKPFHDLKNNEKFTLEGDFLPKLNVKTSDCTYMDSITGEEHSIFSAETVFC